MRSSSVLCTLIMLACSCSGNFGEADPIYEAVYASTIDTVFSVENMTIEKIDTNNIENLLLNVIHQLGVVNDYNLEKNQLDMDLIRLKASAGLMKEQAAQDIVSKNFVEISEIGGLKYYYSVLVEKDSCGIGSREFYTVSRKMTYVNKDGNPRSNLHNVVISKSGKVFNTTFEMLVKDTCYLNKALIDSTNKIIREGLPTEYNDKKIDITEKLLDPLKALQIN